ncbi:MAG: DUF721 domain-containing protein [Desulfobacteraceae bacterium]|nr:DUF721 domain-containing protein [Desulfobacteraceae bacterium]
MTNTRYKNENFSHIGEVLSNIIGRVRRESDSELARIRELWQHGLDPVISENSRPEALKNDILLVNVASSTVIQQLRFLTPDIMEQLNRALGDNRIGRIKYKVGPVYSGQSK